MKCIDFHCTNSQSRSMNDLLYAGTSPLFKQVEVWSCQLGYHSVSASRRGATTFPKVTASEPAALDAKAVEPEEDCKAVMKELSTIDARKLSVTVP